MIAELCLAHKKNMLTASYVTPQMKDFHDRYISYNIDAM